MPIIKTDFKKEFNRLGDSVQKYPKAIRRAQREAVNQGLTRLNKEAAKKITTRYNLKQKELKDHLFKKFRAKANEATATFVLLPRKFSLMHFMTNPKDGKPQQKGIPIKSRKKIKVKVIKGRTVTLPNTFIAPTSTQARPFGFDQRYQLFTRREETRLKIRRNTVAPISHYFRKPSTLNPLIRNTQVRVIEVFRRKAPVFIGMEMQRNFARNLRAL